MIKGKPLWFYNPNMNGKVGAIGIAKHTKNGSLYSQKRLASMLAKADYAKQQKSQVNASYKKATTVDNGNVKKSSSSTTTQTSSQFVRRVTVKDLWMDPKSCALYMWAQ